MNNELAWKWEWGTTTLTTTLKEVDIEDQRLVYFMQECRERLTEMGDKKCEYCKLRFRCYTEIGDKESTDFAYDFDDVDQEFDK